MTIGCRAQSTARSGGRGRKRQGRTGGSRKGEASQRGCAMDDYGDGCDKTQDLSQ